MCVNLITMCSCDVSEKKYGQNALYRFVFILLDAGAILRVVQHTTTVDLTETLTKNTATTSVSSVYATSNTANNRDIEGSAVPTTTLCDSLNSPMYGSSSSNSSKDLRVSESSEYMYSGESVRKQEYVYFLLITY